MAKQKLQLSHLPKFNLRLQPDMKMRLEKLAKAVPHSLNAEITTRLEQSFNPHRHLTDYTDGELIDELIRRWGRDAVHIRLGKDGPA